MDYLIAALLLAVLGLVAYLAFFRKHPDAAGADAGTAILLEEVRQQLATAQATTERERAAKIDALSRVAGADAAKQAAQTQLTEDRAAQDRALTEATAFAIRIELRHIQLAL